MSDSPATGPADENELLVRDADGTFVPLDQVRRAVRAMGTADEAARAANRAGEVHPSQDPLVRAPGHGADYYLLFFGPPVVLTGVLFVVVGATSDNRAMVRWSAPATIAAAVMILGLFVVLRRVRVARRRKAPVTTLRDRVEAVPRADGHLVPARLSGRRIGLSSRFAGVPVVAHVLDGRAPLVLSADLDDASLSTVSRAQMEAAARTLPVHPPETLRGEGIRENVIWTVASVAIIALAVVGIVTDATPDVVDVSWIVGGLACFSLLLALIVWPGARHQAAVRYEIVDDADGVTVTVHRPHRPPVVIRSAAVTRLAHHPAGSRRGMWYVSADGVHVGIAARTGERVVRAIRRRRPDLGISTTRVGR